MAACFIKGYPLRYQIVNKTVVVLPGFVDGHATLAEKSLPQFAVKGKVTDKKGNPLVGVTISLKGTRIGTTTDLQGEYSLSMPEAKGTLVFTYVGYSMQEVPINGRNEINVAMEASVSALDQLVVVGYSTQQKKDLTGAVSVVDMKDLKNKPVAGVGEMLKGEVPGLTVNNDYSPGGGVAIRIRGFSTIDNNNPLYIIDGVPSTGGLNTINPNDIASIQVLKDAASASIYGSRAANGVIIITTKQGKTGKPKISFNGYTGVQEAFHLPQMLSAQQYGDMLWEAMKNDGITPSNDVYGSGGTPVIPKWLDTKKTVPSGNVNWIKELFHPAITQSYNLSISNGTKDAHQYFSLGYLDQDGTMKYTGFKRITAMMNTDGTFFDRLKIGENFTASYTTTTAITNNSVNSGVLYDAFKFPSISPVYDINGNYAGSPLNDAWNPLGALYRNRSNRMKDVNLFGNVFADLLVVKGLHLKTNVGLNYATTNFRDYSPKYVELGTLQSQSTLATSNEYSYNVVWSNTAEYKMTLGKNNFDLLGGMETVKNYEEDFSGSRIGFPFDAPNFQYLNAGSGSTQTNTGTGSQWSLLSFFGNLTYNYDQRYLLSATVRRDGSSKLGNNKWGNFPAISAGWNIAQESFFHVKFIDQLKIRASWGKNGNQDIPTYSTIDGYISDPNNSNYSINGIYNSTTTGYIQSRVANPDLKWETTTQIDYGLDFGLFNSSLQGSVDYFNKNTTDMLVQLPLPPVMGGTNQTTWVNGGSMNNKGIEIQLTYRHTLNNNLSFTIGGNIASYKNKLTSLPTGVPYIGISTATLHGTNFDQEVARTYVGDPLGSFYGYKVLGLFQDEQQISKYGMEPNAHPGDFIFADVNKDGVIDDKDRTYIGSPLPKFTYGFNASVSWEHFDLSFFIQGSYGNKIYDLTRYYGGFFDLSDYNKFSWVEDAWTSGNTHTSIPRLSVLDPNNNIRPSSYYVQPGSYARLKNIQLGYNFPEKMVHGDLRVYIMAENLLTITRYSGMNPEVGFQNYNSDNESLDNGVDRGLYPPSKMFIAGVNMTF
ncbi:MAG: TonB-dependent receptor [Chitinophagaceae bacterium]|nr:MAG: TonB-dependent receptor [Chitinophagaceae bacterium]